MCPSEHRKHENEKGLGSTTTARGIGSTQGTGYSSGMTTAGPHSSDLENKADSRIDSNIDNSRTMGTSGAAGSNTTPGHHLGRDAAAVGTAGAVEEGTYHHRENEPGLGSNTGMGYTGTSQASAYHTGPIGTAVQGVSKFKLQLLRHMVVFLRIFG
jgi:hypothetical protein